MSIILGLELNLRKVLDWAFDLLDAFDDEQLASVKWHNRYNTNRSKEGLAEFREELFELKAQLKELFPEGEAVGDDRTEDADADYKKEAVISVVSELLNRMRLDSGGYQDGLLFTGGEKQTGCCYTHFEDYRVFFGKSQKPFKGRLPVPGQQEIQQILDSYNLSPLYKLLGAKASYEVALYIMD